MDDSTAIRLAAAVEAGNALTRMVLLRIGARAQWATTEEIREVYGIGRSRLYELARQEKVRGSRAGRVKRWFVPDVHRHVFGVALE